MVACRKLIDRMRPIKEKLPNVSWPQLVEQCFFANVDLSARHW